MSTRETLVSSRLAGLQAEIESGNTAALDTFWQEVTQHGTPLVEPIAGEGNTTVHLTFLWRAPIETKNVGVNSRLGGGPDFATEPMNRLLDTDLWHKTYRVRDDLRTTYRLALDNGERPDPLNHRRLVYPADEESFFGREVVTSIVELPAAPAQTWINTRSGVASGQVEHHTFRSSILGNERRIWVYTPAGYQWDRKPYNLLVLFDRWAYAQIMAAPTVLDNLIASGSLQPLVAVMISSINPETRARELLCNAQFDEFLVQELIPWVRDQYHVTGDPARTVVGGLSAGGLAAAYSGLRHPDLFGNVLSQSGYFVYKPDDETEYEWLTRQFARMPRLALSFYLEVGLLDVGSDTGDIPSFLVANRHLRDVLRARGYPIEYAEYNGSHSFVCWQDTLADGLIALLGSKVPNRLGQSPT